MRNFEVQNKERMISDKIKYLEHLMEWHSVKPSPVRSLVLRQLLDADAPMSVQDIEAALQTVDRSSVTRSITVFRENGLVHSIDDGSGSVKYELCRSEEETCSDEHVHFHCEKCGRTICLPDTHIPIIKLPQGFTAEKSNFVIVGICDNCQNS